MSALIVTLCIILVVPQCGLALRPDSQARRSAVLREFAGDAADEARHVAKASKESSFVSGAEVRRIAVLREFAGDAAEETQQELVEELQQVHQKERPRDPPGAIFPCQRDPSGQRIGCKGGCACTWWEHCYTHNSSDILSEDTGVCEMAMPIISGVAILTTLCLLAFTLGTRLLLEHWAYLKERKERSARRIGSIGAILEDMDKNFEQLAAEKSSYHKMMLDTIRSQRLDMSAVGLPAPHGTSAPPEGESPRFPHPQWTNSDRSAF